MTDTVSAAQLLAQHRELFDALSPLAKRMLRWRYDFWLRPEQLVPLHHWRSCGFDAGRGDGKTFAISVEINRRVTAGVERHIALMAPTEDRVDEVQIASLIANAPPWNRPARHRGGLRWPNGCEAIVFTPEAPGRSRSENISLSWLCELVDWNPTTRIEAFDNITTATRIGRAQILWDSTHKGSNDLLDLLASMHAKDPRQHVIVHGTTFDNPLLSEPYLRSEWDKYPGVRRREELFGERPVGAAGALWKQLWLDRTRVAEAPRIEWECIGVDPATKKDGVRVDETGIVRGGRGYDGHAYILEDRTANYAPEEWGDVVVSMCPRGGRVVIETNHVGDNAAFVLRSRATTKGLLVKAIGRDEPWPPLDERCIHVREVFSRDSKTARAEGPAAETEAGRAHMVGHFPQLEHEMITYVQGASRSPNRYDAAAFAITELLELALEVTRASREADAATAALVHTALQTALAGRPTTSGPTRPQAYTAGRSRRMGL